MALRTAFTELVGCDVPVQQAPIGYPAATAALPGAVAAAGGHGMLSGVRMPPDVLGRRLEELSSRTRAFGVNFIQAMAPPEALAVAAERAPLIELYMGPPAPDLVERAHAAGALVSRQVSSVEEARSAQDEGCDVIVARGIEAGGHSLKGSGLLPLLDAVLEAVEVPVVAAGGIATARGLAAVLAAGASAARVGTRFLAADEADAPDAYVQAVLDASLGDSVLTTAFSPDVVATQQRLLRSSLEAAQAFEGDVVARMTVHGAPMEVPRFSPDNPAGDATGHVEAMALFAGESAAATRRRQPAGEIVRELASGAEALLARAGQWQGAEPASLNERGSAAKRQS